MGSAPRYEVVYFPMRGRAEPIRLLLGYTGTPFTDSSVSNWAAEKGKTPLGQLPLLIERSDGKEWTIPQSGAILRHLARTLGAYGDNEQERVLADVVADTVEDIQAKVIPVAYAALYRTPAAVVSKYFADELPQVLGLLAKLLGHSAHPAAGLFVGQRPTYADLMAFDILDAHLQLKPACLEKSPSLRAFHERIRSLPALAAYLAGRRPSELQPIP